MRIPRYFTLAAAALLAGATARAQPPQEPAPGPATFHVFLGGSDIGREQVNLARAGSNWILTSSGRLAGPFGFTVERFEVRYTADWQPLELALEASQAGRRLGLATSFGLTTAVNEITEDAATTSKTDQVTPRTVALPNQVFGAYEAVAARLARLEAGAELPLYVAPQTEVMLVVRRVERERISTPDATLDVRRFSVTVHNPGGPLDASVVVDDRSRLARLEIPSAGLAVIREDLAGVAARPQTFRNATDVDVSIPALGFSLAGTVTTPPAAAGRLRHPAVVLVPGSGPVDRDALVAGIPIFAQLAGALAERGFLVVRYDKRGVGQSGGRTETATLADYAEDVSAVVRWVGRRRDVDDRRVAVVGHSEGGAVALLAAGRDRRIRSIVLAAAPGIRGEHLILEQQRHVLETLKTPGPERDEKVALQKKIQAATISGEGWEGVPPELRRQADTPWFRSLLLFDPAEAMARTRQPVLVLQGALDTQVPPYHAERLAGFARERRRGSDLVEVAVLPGLNHLLVPAGTGEVGEYAHLKERAVSAEVAERIAAFLK